MKEKHEKKQIVKIHGFLEGLWASLLFPCAQLNQSGHGLGCNGPLNLEEVTLELRLWWRGEYECEMRKMCEM